MHLVQSIGACWPPSLFHEVETQDQKDEKFDSIHSNNSGTVKYVTNNINS
jgi:hypothetical protein